MTQSEIHQYYIDQYDELVKRYYTRSGGNSEDIVQEAFTRALKYAHTYDGKQPLENWFSRILQNAFRDFMNEQRNYGMNMVSEGEDIPDPDTREGEHLRRDVARYIKDNMPENEQEILLLYYIHGYGFKDIVRITDEKYRRVNYVVYKFEEHLKKLGEEVV